MGVLEGSLGRGPAQQSLQVGPGGGVETAGVGHADLWPPGAPEAPATQVPWDWSFLRAHSAIIQCPGAGAIPLGKQEVFQGGAQHPGSRAAGLDWSCVAVGTGPPRDRPPQACCAPHTREHTQCKVQ